MTRPPLGRYLRAAWLTGLILGCRPGSGSARASPPTFDPGPAPASLVVGENLFGRYCGSCHGERGTGDVLGPSFLDTLYLPPRLTQQAVIDAVLNGVRQKHWRFGDMPPLRRVSGNELLAIFGYIQWVQLRGLARQAHGTVGKVAP